MHRVLSISFVVFVLSAPGCNGSRWAKYDPGYARMYPEHSDNILQMAKQAVDARHLSQRQGTYIAGAAQTGSSSANAEVGRFLFIQPWQEQQIGLAAVYSDDLDDLFIGGKIARRIQPPSRFAPFVGVGGFGGLFHKGTGHDFAWLMLSSDDDDWDPGDDGLHPMFAVYPEAGVHWWLNHRIRLSGSMSYYVTSEGRDHDYWFAGLAISLLDLPKYGWDRDNYTDRYHINEPVAPLPTNASRENSDNEIRRLPPVEPPS